MMHNILLFGAGKSATVLIDYLLCNAQKNDWRITIADSDIETIQLKTKNHPNSNAVTLNIVNAPERRYFIEQADLVISMMPPFLHELIAADCVFFSKSLLTASYVDSKMKSHAKEIEEKNLIFLCEMGLDPGIDHMSAMKIFDELKDKGAKIISFKSHCGGLVAPESDDNCWHYKISWNPRNVVLAGSSGAVYLEDGKEKTISYSDIFDCKNNVSSTDNSFNNWGYYPNRNSLNYIEIYHLKDVSTFMRTTLRHPGFMEGWGKLVDCGLTTSEKIVDATGLSFRNYYQSFAKAKGFNWDELFLTSPMFKEQMECLGFNDDTLITKPELSAADVLQMAMEKNWMLSENDKDLVVMVHEVEYVINEKKYLLQSCLEVTGENNLRTAMAKTVGLPLGIAAKLILNGQIKLKGLHIPVLKEIYQPVLRELEQNGIIFREVVTECG